MSPFTVGGSFNVACFHFSAGTRVPKVCVADNFSATPTDSDYERVLLGTKYYSILAGQFSYSVLLHQPFRNVRVNQGGPNLLTMPLAEVLEGSFRYKRVNYLEMPR